MNANKPLHVIFGTGPVGLAVMDELCSKDVRIRMVNRSGSTAEPLPDDVELVAGDASDVTFTTEAAQGADVIYFALNPPYHRWLELFPPMQAAVLSAAESVGAKLVVMENLYMYGDTDGAPLTEGLRDTAHTRKGALRAAMHRELMDAHETGRVQVVTGRASDFYGPRVSQSAMGELVFEKVVAGKTAQFIGDLSMPHTQSYMPDVARGLVALAFDDDAYGKAWHLPAAPAMTQGAFIEAAYAAAGHKPRIQVMPNWMLRVLGIFSPALREFPEMMYEFEKPFVLDSTPFERRYGFGATPTEIGIRETVAWYQAQVN